MTNIPVNTPLGLVGFGLLILGVFLLLTGFNILKIEKITVKPGKPTWVTGILMALFGVVLLVQYEPVKQPIDLPTATPEPVASPSPMIAETPNVVATTADASTTDPYELAQEASNWPVVLSEPFENNNAGWNVDGWDSE